MQIILGMQQRSFDGQRSSKVDKTGQCAKEKVSSSLLGKLALPSLLQTYS